MRNTRFFTSETYGQNDKLVIEGRLFALAIEAEILFCALLYCVAKRLEREPPTLRQAQGDKP